jgi:hypothetical protein
MIKKTEKSEARTKGGCKASEKIMQQFNQAHSASLHWLAIHYTHHQIII